MSSFNRSNYYSSFEVDGISEIDFLSNILNTYTFKYPMVNYTLEYQDYLRPDLLSKKLYGTNQYWWIILRCNPGFDDIWNDFGYSQETIDVNASDVDPTIKAGSASDSIISVDKHEYKYPNSFKVGEIISVPQLRDIQDLYTLANQMK